jgi:hypothetical protein
MDGLAELATPETMARLDAALKDVPVADGPVIDGGGEVERGQQQPAAAAEKSEKVSDSLKTDEGALAATDTTKVEQVDTKGAADTSKGKPEADKQPKTEFSKDQVRRDTSWKALNAEKERVRAEQEQFRQEREQFQREREQQALKSAKSRYSPEQYEEAAGKMVAEAKSLELQAKGLEKEAQELEDNGDYKKAEHTRAQAQEMREAAIYQKKSADNAKLEAKRVRENPDPTLQQVQQRNQQALRHYTMEAAKKFPEFAKEGGEFQQKVATELQAGAKLGIDANEHPVLMYQAARLVAAETAAARVPGLEKELGELKAKVKDFEVLTAPGGGQDSARRGETAPTKFEDMSPAQQAAHLSQNAGLLQGR